MEPITFTKERISAKFQVSDALVNQFKLYLGRIDDDHIKGLFTAQIESFLLTSINEVKEITIYKKPQGFWDWILRKPQKNTFTIKCREVLKNPPILPEGQSVLMYEVNHNL